jgi:hypothetical protein
VIKMRAMRALENTAARYPIFRRVRCAARRKLEVIFDDLATQTGLTALRLAEGELLLDGPGVFIEADGWRKAGYCSCQFGIWTDSVQRLTEVREQLFRIVGDRHPAEQTFTIGWYYTGQLSRTQQHVIRRADGRSALRRSVSVARRTDCVVREPLSGCERDGAGTPGRPRHGQDPAGPRHPERDLGAQGEQRQGAVHGGQARPRKRRDLRRVRHRANDAFVIEDADHMLLARSNGNHDLHRFLASQTASCARKAARSSSLRTLANVKDIDEALLRPGRCFANVRTRNLRREEAGLLMQRMIRDGHVAHATLEELFATGAKDVAVAGIYRAFAR